MRDVKYGAVPPESPPVAAHRAAVQSYEQAGIDFVAYGDQQSLTIPRSIWTEDLCPAASLYSIDSSLEPFALATDAALATNRIRIGITAADVIRRPPSILAQLGITLDHYAEGRFFLTLGAGELKQCVPYGIPRRQPFGHLEEALQLLRMWWSSDEPINYDGKFWNVRNGVIGVSAYTPGGPDLLVAGGPGKAMRFGATIGDGWLSYTPASHSPEAYASEITEFRRYADEAGKDAEAMTRMVMFMVVLGDDDDHVEELVNNAAIRWDAAAVVTGGETWRRHGVVNPMGADFAYARDLIPMEWSREDALRIVDQVPTAMVRKLRMCGTPVQVAEMIQPYIEAGCNHVMALDYALLRKLNGQNAVPA